MMFSRLGGPDLRSCSVEARSRLVLLLCFVGVALASSYPAVTWGEYRFGSDVRVNDRDPVSALDMRGSSAFRIHARRPGRDPRASEDPAGKQAEGARARTTMTALES